MTHISQCYLYFAGLTILDRSSLKFSGSVVHTESLMCTRGISYSAGEKETLAHMDLSLNNGHYCLTGLHK